MSILLGIISFHLLVMFRAKFIKQEGVPYISTLFITVALVAYTVFMLFMMEKPSA